METILIAADFSEASRNASFYGTKLAKLLGATVVLLNVYSLSDPATDPVSTVTNQELRRSLKDGLRHEVGWLDLNETIEIEKRSTFKSSKNDRPNSGSTLAEN